MSAVNASNYATAGIVVACVLLVLVAVWLVSGPRDPQ